MQYYVFADKPTADDALAAINGAAWFPVVGNVNGIPAPDNQQTTKWCEAPIEMLTGEWAIPRIPDERLDAVGVPQAERDAFLAVYGNDIRNLTTADFPAPPEE